MKVSEAMHNVTRVNYMMTAAEAAKIMDAKVIGSVLIEKDRKIVGMMTERDILRKIVAKGRDPASTAVHEIMTSPLITVNSDSDLGTASRIMDQHRIRRLIVTEEDKIVGIITARNLAKNLRYVMGSRLASIDKFINRGGYVR